MNNIIVYNRHQIVIFTYVLIVWIFFILVQISLNGFLVGLSLAVIASNRAAAADHSHVHAYHDMSCQQFETLETVTEHKISFQTF